MYLIINNLSTNKIILLHLYFIYIYILLYDAQITFENVNYIY